MCTWHVYIYLYIYCDDWHVKAWAFQSLQVRKDPRAEFLMFSYYCNLDYANLGICKSLLGEWQIFLIRISDILWAWPKFTFLWKRNIIMSLNWKCKRIGSLLRSSHLGIFFLLPKLYFWICGRLFFYFIFRTIILAFFC